MADDMNPSTPAPITVRPDRDAKIDARCSKEIRAKLLRIAMVKDAQLSDIVRDALKQYVMRAEQQFAA